MRHIDVLNKNKDLDLRRFGKNEYTKALNSSDSEGTSTESLADSIIRVLNLEEKKYYGVPDIVLLCANKDGYGIIGNLNVTQESLDAPINIGDTQFSVYYVPTNEDRYKAFDEFSMEDLENLGPEYYPQAYFGYKVSTVQDVTPAGEYPSDPFVSAFRPAFGDAADGGSPDIFYADYAQVLFKYNDEYYVFFVNLG